MKKKIWNTVLGSVINKKGEILLIKRNKEPYIGLWSLPGGSIEFGEYLEEAVEREIKEETDIDVKFAGLKGLVHEILQESISGEKLDHYFLWVCELKPAHFNTKASCEGPLKWFKIDKLKDNEKIIAPSDFLMINKFFRGKSPDVKFHKVKIIKNRKSYNIEDTDL